MGISDPPPSVYLPFPFLWVWVLLPQLQSSGAELCCRRPPQRRACPAMTSTAYSRSSKLPGGGPERRLPPRLMRSLTSKIEPKKLGVGLVAGCCLALLTYVSLAKLFAIYSPVFGACSFDSIPLFPPPLLLLLPNLTGAAFLLSSQLARPTRLR